MAKEAVRSRLGERHQIKAHVRRASLDRSPDSSSRQIHAESVVETIGPVRLPYGGSQLHEMFGRKRFLQFVHHRFRHGRLLRELLGERDN